MLNFTKPIVNKFPSGKWGFVGRVPVVLGYERPDGQPVTHEDAENCAQFGPRLAKLQSRVFDTKEAAEAALEAYQDELLTEKLKQRQD